MTVYVRPWGVLQIRTPGWGWVRCQPCACLVLWCWRHKEISHGSHPPGTYACPDCRPTAAAGAPAPDRPRRAPGPGPGANAQPERSDPAAETKASPEQRRGRHRPDRPCVRCEGKDAEVVLSFPYDAAMVSEAKAISGRHFDWNTKTNVHPFTRCRKSSRWPRTRHQRPAPSPRTRTRRSPAALVAVRSRPCTGDLGSCPPLPEPRPDARARLAGHK